jgi:hypothetical protein
MPWQPDEDVPMRIRPTLQGLSFAAIAAAASVTVTSCSRNRDVYDSSGNVNRRWDSREEQAYRRWEAERRYDHMEFTRRRAEEQRQYWDWRRSHP